MWPLMLIRSAPSDLGEKSSLQKACTASVCSRASEPASFKTRETAAIPVTAPVSLLTSIRETSIVSGRSAFRTASGSTAPVGSGGR